MLAQKHERTAIPLNYYYTRVRLMVQHHVDRHMRLSCVHIQLQLCHYKDKTHTATRLMLETFANLNYYVYYCNAYTTSL